MPVQDVIQDPASLTLTVIATYPAPVARVFRVWAEPALLGKWWGPPGWPATFLSYTLEVGGRAHYFMQGPDGTRHYGGWAFTAVDAPHALAFDDYFADAEGTPNRDLPGTSVGVTLVARDGGTTMTLVSRFGSLEQMEQLVAMGMVDGIRAAAGQIDALL
ncbi:MAG: polyketide cyclase [Deltaproteobacteria bacterium HGW-Deltaproteobacteria-14]|jgi:uncharacterized protein YndB with AHSA1/START domain|nr:MAG: polyketide cyclase [Deltaproteobacteria bacterium HGW-Deltaproteobacteria-14]